MAKKKKSKKLSEEQVKRGCQLYIFIAITLASSYYLISLYQEYGTEKLFIPTMFLSVGVLGIVAVLLPNSWLGIWMNTPSSGKRLCFHCFKEISSWATTCPYCHRKQHSST